MKKKSADCSYSIKKQYIFYPFNVFRGHNFTYEFGLNKPGSNVVQDGWIIKQNSIEKRTGLDGVLLLKGLPNGTDVEIVLRLKSNKPRTQISILVADKEKYSILVRDI